LEHCAQSSQSAQERGRVVKSWWSGDNRVEPFMHKVRATIEKYHKSGSPECTDIYNRAYEAVYDAIRAYDKSAIANVLAKHTRPTTEAE